MEFDRLERIPDKDFLKIDQQASQTDVRKAYEAERLRWAKSRHLVEDERSMVSKVDEIQDRLAQAYNKMVANRQTAAPATQQAPSGPTPSPELVEALAQASRQVDVVTEPRAATKPKSVTPPSVTTKPVVDQESESPPPPELPPLDEALVEEVHMELAPVPPPPPLDEPPETQPAFNGEPTSASPSSTLPAGTAPRTTQYTDAQRRTRIQQLFRDVKLHFQVRDWEGAVSLLYELVKLAPDNASYHGMLARAMARHPVMRKDAERHFIKALRLTPQSADLHFSLGLYYKSFGMKSRAETEFRTVLRIQSSHEGARKHLLGPRRKDPLRDMFRKIFG
jgi:tetratricopeptide (TPR) repeat protein